MHITWLGVSCLRLQTNNTTLLIDPFSSTIGLQAPRLQADVFLFSQLSNPQVSLAHKGQSFVFDTPGEYEHSGIVITGIGVPQTAGKIKETITVFTLGADGVVVGLLGPLARPLTDAEVEHLENVDLLFLPVGGKPVLTTDEAADVISRLEPRVVIPYYYQTPGLKLPLQDASVFLKEMGVKQTTPQEKYRITKRDLPEEDMDIVVLKAT